MVTFNVYKSTASGTYVEGVCLTSDEKPVAGIANGSILFAVDPSDGGMIRYMFNQSSASWVETTCPCSGGGSGSGEGPLIVTESIVESEYRRLDKTWQEIYNAVEAGRNVYLTWDDEDPETIFMPRLALGLISAEWDAGGSWPSPYVVRFSDGDTIFSYGATDPSHYPVEGTQSSSSDGGSESPLSIPPFHPGGGGVS